MHAFEAHIQWNAVKEVVEKLKAKGFQALLAGGCVRDLIMNREPNDFDVATNALPDAVEALFPRALTVGREFGVTILPYDGFQVEVATFRKDGPYEDGRRPTHVVFCTPEEDARRRDFTVNALFFDLSQSKIIDYVGGEADIQARVIRAVGDPDLRFDEDKLRILRAIRFAAQLDFRIDEGTLEAVRRHHAQVDIVALERVRDEVLKMLKACEAPKGLALLRETQLLEIVFKEIASILKQEDVFQKTSRRLQGGSSPAELAMLRLVFDSSETLGAKGPDVIKTMLKRMKFSNHETDAIVWILKTKSLYIEPSRHRQADLIRALANPHSVIAEKFYAAHEQMTPEIQNTWAEIHRTVLGGTRQLPERWITGYDLQNIGVPKGPGLGQLHDEVFHLQLEGQLKDKDEALGWVKAKVKSLKP